ncbi:MAG: polyisoprenoid-binding protein [Acidimicrobiaceae bacterium]|jgi:polyisoprenoid-binding protein YceI|nr:polyisoprenoid-binding protein [Acidimicrobiaceae bacterium]
MADAAELTRTVDGATIPHPGVYTLDKAHSSVGFVVRHMMVSKVRGLFNDFEGTITVAEDPAQSGVEATVQIATVDTRDEQRDGHLKSADFFEVEKFPTMTFTSTKVVPDGGDDWKVQGDLTIHGVTRPVVLDVEFNGASGDPYGGKRIGFSATTEIDREDFGMTFNMALETGGVVVSKNVKIEIEAEAVLQV